MKNWINRIPKDKLQRYIFLGALILVFAAFFISLALIGNNNEPPIDEVPPGHVDDEDDDDDDDDDDDIVEEFFKMPTKDEDYEIVRKFYDIEASKEDQELALHVFNKHYSTSDGVSISKSEESFDVVASVSGVIDKIEENALRGYIVTIKHKNDVYTEYSSLSSVNIAEGDVVEQGELIGVSGESEYDELDNHVHFKIIKKNTSYNPETLIGKKLTDLK